MADGWLNDAVRFWQRQSGTTGVRSASVRSSEEDTVYSLGGVRQKGLRKGVNIVNGKKIVVR